MTSPISTLAALVLAVASLALPASAQPAPPAPDSIRVVAMDEIVQSRKRGVCANKLHPEDFIALAPGVSWYYNWHFAGDQPPEGTPFEFIPMVWGDTPERLEGLKNYLAQGHRPRAILINNEPNLKGQAFITPAQSADLHRRVYDITRDLNIPLVGPHMAIGSGRNASITAHDPIEDKEVTYTFMIPFLRAFLHFLGDTRIDGIGVHPYGQAGEAIWSANITYREFQKPVWVTEYAWWHAPDMTESIRYLVKATHFYEHAPHVHGYAWFKERIPRRATISLLTENPGELSELGQAYVRMPVHDPALHYRLPGRLNAARHAGVTAMDIDLAHDPADFLRMYATDANARITYHLYAPEPLTLDLRLSASGPAGEFHIQLGEHTVGTVALPDSDADASARPTSTLTLTLPQGPHQLTVLLPEKGQSITSLEFTPR